MIETENEKIVKEELASAISSMTMCIPLLEEMNGKIPTEIISLLDEINRLSVMF